jgi:quinol monooxygenase YgiN
VNDETGEKQRQQAERHIDVEHAAPAVLIRDPASIVGPMAGASTTAIPYTANAMPRLAGGNVSARIACSLGPRPPPPAPCRMRKRISIPVRRVRYNLVDMRKQLHAVQALLALLFLICGATAQAQEPVYVVTHIDVAGNTFVQPANALLRQLVADTAKEKGCSRIEILVQDGRPNHFTLVGVWKDKQAFEEHDGAGYTKQFREKIQPMLGSPWDERLHQLLKP